MQRTAYDIIKKPIITEKTMGQSAEKKYTFEVAKDVNKIQIKQAVEEVFGVKVKKVNTMNVLGKVKTMGRNEGKRADWKKAIVILADNSKKIAFFEEM